MPKLGLKGYLIAGLLLLPLASGPAWGVNPMQTSQQVRFPEDNRGDDDAGPIALPPGNWTLSIYPDLYPDSQFVPLLAFSVTTNARKGLTANKVGLWNRASRGVSAVKLEWRLSRSENMEHVLLRGETPVVAIPGGIPEGKEAELNFPVVSFARIYKALLEPGSDSLFGEFHIRVLVSEVIYDDGSTWTRNEMFRSGVKDYGGLTQKLSADCPMEKRVFSDAFETFKCDPTTSKILCTNFGSECRMSICGGRSQAIR